METKSDSGSFFKRITYTQGIYPEMNLQFISSPNRFFAFPLIGMLIKLIILIPVFIEIFFLCIWLAIVVALINPFVVLFTGKYWTHAHSFVLGFMKLNAKLSLYIYGLSDKYPGFDFSTPPGFSFDIPIPQNPGKLYTIPLLGFLIRVIFLIPYYIFLNVINNAVTIGVFLLAWAVVLFKGKYPEGIFELARDSIRVNMSASAYLFGLSDRYPSFYISMTHDKIKIILIAIAIILNGWNYSQEFSDRSEREQGLNNYNYQYQLDEQMSPSMQDYEMYQEQLMQEN